MSDGDVHRADDVGKFRRLKPRQIAIIVLLGIVILFAVLNLDKARIDVLVTSVRLPVVFVIVVSGLIGFSVGYLLARHLENRD
jgi:uncharacterized integral membrane protein